MYTVLLQEDGYFEPLPWWKNPEIDDEEWRSVGWKVVTPSGERLFFHAEKATAERWLADNGYVATPDGIHYQDSGARRDEIARQLRAQREPDEQ